MRWIELVARMLEEIPEQYFGALEEVRPGERVAGTVSEETLKVLALSLRLEDQMHTLAAEHLLAHIGATCEHDSAVCKKLKQQIVRLRAQAETVREIFWTTLRLECNIWDEHIGIRKGRKVVAVEERDVPTAEDILTIAGILTAAIQQCGEKERGN